MKLTLKFIIIYIINVFHIFHVFNLQHNRQLCSKSAKEVYCERFYNESADPKWNWKCSPSSLKGLRDPGLHSRFSSLEKDICLQHWEINFTRNTIERNCFTTYHVYQGHICFIKISLQVSLNFALNCDVMSIQGKIKTGKKNKSRIFQHQRIKEKILTFFKLKRLNIFYFCFLLLTSISFFYIFNYSTVNLNAFFKTCN